MQTTEDVEVEQTEANIIFHPCHNETIQKQVFSPTQKKKKNERIFRKQTFGCGILHFQSVSQNWGTPIVIGWVCRQNKTDMNAIIQE